MHDKGGVLFFWKRAPPYLEGGFKSKMKEHKRDILSCVSLSLFLRLKIGKRGVEEEIRHGMSVMLQFVHEGLHLMGDVLRSVGQQI